MTGVSAIQYYSVKIYSQIGISGSNALKYQAINSVIALLGEACCVLFIDKLGRRWPLICGNLFNMVTFLIACILIGTPPKLPLKQSTELTKSQPNSHRDPATTTPPPGASSSCISPSHHPLQPNQLTHPQDLALQLLLLRLLWPSILGHPRRNLRHPHPLQRRLHRHHGLLRLQHTDWSSHRHGHDQRRLQILLPVHHLQLHQRHLLLLVLARDGQTSTGGDELSVYQCAVYCEFFSAFVWMEYLY
jgi:hypothetical protein